MKLGPDLMKVLTIFNQKFTILQQQQQKLAYECNVLEVFILTITLS